MRRNTHRVNDTSWWKLCPECDKWFQVLLRYPGIENATDLPGCCKPCGGENIDENTEKLSALTATLFDEFNEAS